MRMKLLLAASAAALLAACSPEAPAPTVAAAPAKAALGEFGIDLTTADTAVKPGDDKWLARVDKFVADIKRDGRLAAAAKRHKLEPIIAP